MAQSKLIHLEYYDQKAKVRLQGYADTIIYERTKDGKSVVTAIRFGGYPEMVRGLSDAMYGGATVEATIRGQAQLMQCKPKAYERRLAHEGIYASVTMMVKDDVQITEDSDDLSLPADGEEQERQPRTCYLFVPAGDKDRLFEELDRKKTTCAHPHHSRLEIRPSSKKPPPFWNDEEEAGTEPPSI